MYQGYSRGVIPYEKECLTSPEILKQKAIMNEFRMSLFLAPISPVKDDETGKVVKPATLTPYKTTDLQEVYKIITTNEQLKQLTGQVRMAVESGDTQACRRLKQENLPYVTPCGVFTRRRSDCLTETSGLVVVDVDHLQSLAEAEALRQRLFDDPYLCPTLVFVSPTGRGGKGIRSLPARAKSCRGDTMGHELRALHVRRRKHATRTRGGHVGKGRGTGVLPLPR